MPDIHKIRYVLPPNMWVAVYAKSVEPYYHVLPLTDRALVTYVEKEDGKDVFSDAIIGYVAYGGYQPADALPEDSGLIFTGYFNPAYHQAFPTFVEPLENYLTRVANYAKSNFARIPEMFSEPVMEFAEQDGEEDYAGIEQSGPSEGPR